MRTNEDLLIEGILKDEGSKFGPDLSDDQIFARWAFAQALKDRDPSYEDLEFGDVDGGDDGGVDGFFVFIDDLPVREPPEAADIRRNASLEVVLIQAKAQASFKESVFDKLATGLGQLFQLDQDETSLAQLFSSGVLEKRELFKECYIGLASRHPQLSVRIAYVSRGDTASIHQKVESKAELVKKQVQERFDGAQVSVEFLGAKELVARAAASTTYTLTLPFFAYATGEIGGAHILLCALKEYVSFVTDETGNLRRYLFDSNVRDYQGEVEVNKEIARTLESGEDSLDFWWLNNGITILASKATINEKRMVLDGVQIVNGLQTTETLYRHSQSGKP